MRPNPLSALLLTASALALLGPASAALAQAKTEARPETATAAEATTQAPASTNVDAVVVTGTLRTQRLQEVPLAVSSVGADEFEKSGFKEPRELQFLSPSIQVSIQGGNSIVIRGSGTASQNSGTEQSVGMVIDGVLMGFVDDIGGDVTDLDHIEVYRGPQGTQFAKNASSGVVSVTTKKPQIGLWSADGHFTYGEHGDTNDNVRVNIPINDAMAARFVASFQHRDGVFYNVVRDEDEAAREQWGVKGKFLWRPKARTSLYISADYRRESQSPNFPQAWRSCGPPGPTTAYVNTYGTRNLPPCNGALLAGITPSETNTIIVEEDDAWRHTAAGGISANIEYPLGEFQFTSISAFRFMSRHFHGPTGSGIKTNSFLNNIYGGPQYSQEFRIASPAGKPLEFVAGAFFYRRSTHTKSWGIGPQYGLAYFLYPNTIYGSQVQIATAGGGVYSGNLAISKALFTDGTYHVTDKLHLAGGIRVTWDDASATSTTKALPGVYPSVVGAKLKPDDYDKIKATGLTYRIGPQYFFTPDIQLYGSYAHGYKGPLIDTSTDDFGRILPETVNAFEVGLKSAWLDHRLVVNITGFHQKFHNYQVTTLNTSVIPNVFQLGNAGGLVTKGVELELTARATRELTLTAGGTYLDAKFTDYVLACYNTAEPIKQPVTTDPSGVGGCYTKPGTTTRYTNAKGFPLINASKYTWKLGATYTHNFDSGWTIDANANFLHRSSWWAAATDPNIINKGYGILNLGFGISPPGGRYRFGIWARNALNQFFTAGLQANNGGSTNVLNPEAVRTLGVSLDVKLGG